MSLQELSLEWISRDWVRTISRPCIFDKPYSRQMLCIYCQSTVGVNGELRVKKKRFDGDPIDFLMHELVLVESIEQEISRYYGTLHPYMLYFVSDSRFAERLWGSLSQFMVTEDLGLRLLSSLIRSREEVYSCIECQRSSVENERIVLDDPFGTVFKRLSITHDTGGYGYPIFTKSVVLVNSLFMQLTSISLIRVLDVWDSKDMDMDVSSARVFLSLLSRLPHLTVLNLSFNPKSIDLDTLSVLWRPIAHVLVKDGSSTQGYWRDDAVRPHLKLLLIYGCAKISSLSRHGYSPLRSIFIQLPTLVAIGVHLSQLDSCVSTKGSFWVYSGSRAMVRPCTVSKLYQLLSDFELMKKHPTPSPLHIWINELVMKYINIDIDIDTGLEEYSNFCLVQRASLCHSTTLDIDKQRFHPDNSEWLTHKY
jgi:hypothetical protein